ncbi:MAG: DUF5752 family protein [Candidatus Margulisiibacteriota bacterium]|nr:hypothetical protein [Candidatus Margulisiibacteriota bacterium]
MRAKVPFRFYTASQLVQITGRRAAHLKEMVEELKQVEDSSIFYHVHHAYREHQFAPGMYPNDFAHWVKDELGESVLAERLASLNIKEFSDIATLRQRIIDIIVDFLNSATEIRKASAGHEFYFCSNVAVVMQTKYLAYTLDEFCEGLKRVGLRSLFFHFFEARLRLGHKTNDFSMWIKDNFGDKALADQIEALDPYLYTLDQLRDKIAALIRGDDGREESSLLGDIFRWLRSGLKIISR